MYTKGFWIIFASCEQIGSKVVWGKCAECTIGPYGKEECVSGKTVDFKSGCKDEVCKSFEKYETVVTNEEDCRSVPQEVCMDVVVKDIEVVPRKVCETVQKKICDR